MGNKTSKNRYFVMLGITGLLFIMYNVLTFVIFRFELNGACHWISYIFMLLAFAAVITETLLSFRKTEDPRDSFMRMPIYFHSIAYIVIELIVSVGFMIYDDYLLMEKYRLAAEGIGALPFSHIISGILAFVVQFIILCVHLVIVVIAFSAKNTIKSIDNKVQDKTNFIKLLRVDAEMIANRCPDPEAKAVFTKFAEAVRFSDPMSSEVLFELEIQINDWIYKAQGFLESGNYPAAISCCNTASTLLQERNMKTKVLKK